MVSRVEGGGGGKSGEMKKRPNRPMTVLKRNETGTSEVAYVTPEAVCVMYKSRPVQAPTRIKARVVQ